MINKGEVVGYVDVATLKQLPLPEPTSNWYLFCVVAGSEKMFAEKIGETIYYPCRSAWKKFRGKLKNGERRREKKFYPLLPGYVFYNGSPNDQAVNWVYNDKKFIGLLSVEGQPVPVPNTEIHRMRLAEMENFDSVIEVFSVIVGERIEIVSGPFAGKTGIVREIEFGKAKMEFPADGHYAKFTISNLGKISFKR